ncbi:MAG: fibronectin type III-like domain-contianing protein [Lachnospiraceae bacterium]|nr:fibronectin type III-like domain-contianing protein [Lachnospiraceae bacterium]
MSPQNVLYKLCLLRSDREGGRRWGSHFLQSEKYRSVAGKEVVQLYISDWISTVSKPEKELKDFAKVYLEPGTYDLLIGASSQDIRLGERMYMIRDASIRLIIPQKKLWDRLQNMWGYPENR